MKNKTLFIIVAFLVAIIGVDVWLIVTGGYDATISATMLDYGKQYPITVFSLGIVFGHLFWPNGKRCVICRGKMENDDKA